MRHPELARRLLISGLGTFPGPGQRPFYREYNRSSISVAFVSSLSRRFEASLPCYLASPCDQKYKSIVLKCQSLKYQPSLLWPAGFLFASPLIRRVYYIGTDDDDETLLLVSQLTLREAIVPNNANEPKVYSLAPPPLPEYVVEVAL